MPTKKARKTSNRRARKLNSGKAISEVKPLSTIATGKHFKVGTITLSRPSGKSPL